MAPAELEREVVAPDVLSFDNFGMMTGITTPLGTFEAQPANGERFGTFEWQSSASEDVVAEIVEFAYDDDARLFFRPVMPGSKRQLSAGQLWTTKSLWIWRVWSITATSDIAFSNAWTFPN